MAKFCINCGYQLDDSNDYCPSCGTNQNGMASSQVSVDSNYNNPEAKSKLIAGLLGIFLGCWGIHNFYLGYTNRGIIQIFVTLITCGIGGLWGFVEGILILTGSINCDSNGVPLKEQ